MFVLLERYKLKITRYFYSQFNLKKINSLKFYLPDSRNLANALDGVVPSNEVVVTTSDDPDRRLLGKDAAASFIHGHKKRRAGVDYNRF